MIYFLSYRDPNTKYPPVKIAYAASERGLEKTVEKLQEYLPYEIVVEATIKNGTISQKQKIHEQLDMFCLKDEWFKRTRTVKNLIEWLDERGPRTQYRTFEKELLYRVDLANKYYEKLQNQQ